MPKQKVSKKDLAIWMRTYLMGSNIPDIQKDFNKGVKSKKFQEFKQPKFKHVGAALLLAEQEIRVYLEEPNNYINNAENQTLEKLLTLLSNFNKNPKANKGHIKEILDEAHDWITNYAPGASNPPGVYFLCEALFLVANILEIELKDNRTAAGLALGSTETDKILESTKVLAQKIQESSTFLVKRMSKEKPKDAPLSGKSILEHFNAHYLAIINSEELDEPTKLSTIKEQASQANINLKKLLDNRKKLQELPEKIDQLKKLSTDVIVVGFQSFFSKGKKFSDFTENNPHYKVLFELLSEEESQSLQLKDNSKSENNRCLKKLIELIPAKIEYLEKENLTLDAEVNNLVEVLAPDNPELVHLISDKANQKDLGDLVKINDASVKIIDKYNEVRQEIQQMRETVERAKYLHAEVSFFIQKNDKWYLQLADFFQRFGKWFSTESLSEKLKNAQYIEDSLNLTQNRFKEGIQRKMEEFDSNPNINSTIKEKLKQQLKLESTPRSIEPSDTHMKFKKLRQEFSAFSTANEEESKSNLSRSK